LVLKTAIEQTVSLLTILFLVSAPSTSVHTSIPLSPLAVPAVPGDKTVAQFLVFLRQKAQALESSSGMRLAFQSFSSEHHFPGICTGALPTSRPIPTASGSNGNPWDVPRS